MVSAIAIGLFVLLAVVGLAVFTTRYMRGGTTSLPQHLLTEREALARALDRAVSRLPDQPAAAPPASAHPDAAEVETRLRRGDPAGALEIAEQVFAQGLGNDTHVLLARALVACDEPEAALRETKQARAAGESGPMLDYLEARAAHRIRVQLINPDSAEVQGTPVPTIITPFDVLILQLEKQRRTSDRAAAVWLANLGSETLNHDEILALVSEHFAEYYGTLRQLLAATEDHPAFAEALYHAARVALKIGLIERGRELFEKLEPHMKKVPEKSFFSRDLAELRDREQASEPYLPTVSPEGKRGIKLKVLP